MFYSPRPRIADSTPEERAAYVRKRYECIADCDACGNCAFFGGTDPEKALSDYIDGKMELSDALKQLRDNDSYAR